MSDITRTPEELGREVALRRQKKRQTLAGVSRKTKIRVTFLEAIENGSLDELPGNLYVRGFVRAYLETIESLDLWPEYELCLKKMPPVKSGEAIVQYFPPQKGFQKVSRLWIFVFLFLAIGISLYLIWQQKDVLAVKIGAAPEVTETIAEEVSGEAGLQVPEKPLVENEIQAASESPRETPVKPPDTSWIPGQQESPAQESPAPVSGNLLIRTSGPCWLRISGDDGKVIQRTLSRGESLETPINVRTTIRFGNAGAVTLVWGGKENSNIGRPGEVVTIVVLPDGTMKRL